MGNHNDLVQYSRPEIQNQKHKSWPMNRQKCPENIQCFNDKCQCLLKVQSQPNVLGETVKTGIPHTNHFNSSTKICRPVVSSRKSMPFNYQNKGYHGSQPHISVVSNPLQNIEETIKDALKAPPKKKPVIKVVSNRHLFKANRTNIHESQRRVMHDYLTNVNPFPTPEEYETLSCQLGLNIKVIRVNTCQTALLVWLYWCYYNFNYYYRQGHFESIHNNYFFIT
jgi:hypothetical protein